MSGRLRRDGRSGTRRRVLQTAGAALGLVLTVGSAIAHGPLPHKVTETIEIGAPPDKVWRRLGNFADLSWHPAVDSTKADRGNDIGSVRTISLKGEGKLVETLDRYSEAERELAYELLEPGPVPVTNYRATIRVKAGTGAGTLVEWTGSFMRGDPSPRPSAQQNDTAAINAVTLMYRTGLAELKRQLELP